MQDLSYQDQISPTNSVLPPLSKYYYGPGQGRNSPQKVADQKGWEGIDSTSHDSTNPSPAQPQSPATYNAQQWMNHFSRQEQASWQQPGPPPSAPAANNVPVSSYNPNTYGLMPGAHQQPGPGWSTNTSPGLAPDTRSWGVHYNHQHDTGQEQDPGPKPPLPPRPRDSYRTSQHSTQPSYSSNHSFEPPNSKYAQQVNLGSQVVPSNEQRSRFDGSDSPSAPSRLPPAPPPRPPEYEPASRPPQSNQYQDHRYSSAPPNQYLNANYNPSGQPPQSPPSNSEYSDQYSNRHNSYNTQAAHLSNNTGVSVPLTFDDSYSYQPSQDDTEQSVSPVNDSDRWRPPPGQDGNPPPFFPSPNPEPATLARPPGSQQPDSQQRWTMSNAPAQDWSQQVQAAMDNAQVSVTQAPAMDNITRPPLLHDQGNSFYWHSDQSSAPASRATSSNARVMSMSARPPVPQVQPPPVSEERPRKDSEALPGISGLSPSPVPAYGASALGFGGPSDWEHFGDYDAEDIDDTDLYVNVKADKVPELPTDVSPTDKNVPAELPIRHEPVPSSFIPPSPPKPSNNILSSTTAHSSDPDENQSSKRASLPHGLPDKSTILQQNPPTSEVHATQDRKQSIASSSLSTDLHKDRESGISISDFPLPNGHKPARLEEPRGNVVAAEPSPNDALGKNFEHIIEAWTQPPASDQPSNRQNAEEESDKPKALNFSPKPRQSMANISLREQPKLIHRKHHSVDTAMRESNFPTDKSTSLNAQTLSSNNEEREAGADASLEESKVDASSTSEDNGKRSENLHRPTGSISKRPDSSRRNSIIDIRSSNNTIHDLDPWAIASLNRYVAMLNEESKAETNEAKLKIFTVFTARESRLRSVLYEAEEQKAEEETRLQKEASVKRSKTVSKKHDSKALPALPSNASKQNGAEAFTLSRAGSKTETRREPLKESPTLPKLQPITLVDGKSNIDDKEGEDDVQYSPGGRPVVARPPRKSISDNAGTHPTTEDGKDTENETAEEPAYKPFKYEQGRSQVKAYAANRLSKRNSQYRPYAQLTSEPEPPIPVNTDILLAQKEIADKAPKIPSRDKSKERPLPPSLITAPQSKFRVNGIPDPSAANDSPTSRQPEENRSDLRKFVNADFDPLTAVLPKDEVRNETPVQLLDLNNIIDSVPDEFNFIHQSVLKWDSKARVRREVHERERHARQVESEQRIDALFDDHDIGYGDISELESEFKRKEATRKADEDRTEYQTFVSEVFDVVWTQLHFEIDQLSPHYKRFTSLLDTTSAGQDIFTSDPSNLPLAPTMNALLRLHDKIEIRHRKAFEAVLERNRRLKKTEVSPWYAAGNVAKVKLLDRQAETAEKNAIVDYCSQKDARANTLMDVIDQNTLRGVGTNQDYMEMIMKAVRRIASGRAFTSTPGDTAPHHGLSEVHKAQQVTKHLTSASEQIVQTFHVADMLLNAADYEVSVAKSTQSGADRATLERLKEERAKEDGKLMKDLEHRLQLIREDSRKTHDEIVKLLVFLGAQGGNIGDQSATKPLPDPSHQERLQKALEEAKRRNGSVG